MFSYLLVLVLANSLIGNLTQNTLLLYVFSFFFFLILGIFPKRYDL